MNRTTTATGLAALLLVAGCTEKPPTTTAPSASAAVPTSEGPVKIEERTFAAGRDTLAMATPTLVRSGSDVVLTAPVRYAAGRVSSTVSNHFSQRLQLEFDGPRLVDESAGRVYEVARTGTTTGDCTCTASLNLDVGESGVLQAAFTGVPGTAGTMTITIPYAGVYYDVPITAGDVPLPGPAGTSLVADLIARTVQPTASVRRQQTAQQTDISLDADVLFRVDKSDLTPAAAKSIAAAVADLRSAGAGPLTVTGHTDDTGTTAHNQKLSEARARTVAGALTRSLANAQWPKTVAGKGETQPVASNASAPGRRLNRRVTISYAARPSGTAPSTAPEPRPSEPAATGVTGVAAEGVDIVLPRSGQSVHISAGPAVRRGDRLVTTLVVRNDGDETATLFDYLTENYEEVFTENRTVNPYDDSGVHLLDGDTVVLPLGYGLGEDYRADCLCDPDLAETMQPGAELRLPVWFPAPGPGTTTTTVDVPGKFRLTGVPIG